MNDTLITPAVSNTFYADMSALNEVKYSTDKQQSLEIVAKQFESIMYQQILKSMRAAEDVLADDDNPLSSKSTSFVRDLYDGQMAQQFASGGTGSISEMLVKQLTPYAPQKIEPVTTLNEINHKDLS